MDHIVVTLSGQFPDHLTQDDLDALAQDLQDDCKVYYGGTALTVEVVKQ